MSHAMRRQQRLFAAMLAGLVAVIAVLSLRAGHASGAADSRPAVSQSELALRQELRQLWEEHVTWTRLAIVSFAGGLPDLPATEGRLLHNQGDIGRALGSVYGQRAGRDVGALLHQHIAEAVDVLVAAKAGDDVALQKALDAWYANADQIAAALHQLNPDNWSLAEMTQMMHRHLKLTTDEAVAQLTGDYDASVATYDRIEHEIVNMADMLADGIVAQFPERFDS